jgi:hypothetical protein
MGGPTYAYWNGTLWEPWIPIDKDLADYAFNHAGDTFDPREPHSGTTVAETSADYQKALYVMLLLAKNVDTIQTPMNSAAAADIISQPNNNKFTMGEFMSTWDQYSYTVTDKTYPAGYGGKSEPTGSEVRFTTIYDTTNSNLPRWWRRGCPVLLNSRGRSSNGL